jgi:hypothetical protein
MASFDFNMDKVIFCKTEKGWHFWKIDYRNFYNLISLFGSEIINKPLLCGCV